MIVQLKSFIKIKDFQFIHLPISILISLVMLPSDLFDLVVTIDSSLFNAIAEMLY